MKKTFCLLLIFFLLFVTGCAEEDAHPVYPKPTFTPGTLQSDLLKTEPGNFDRANYTNRGRTFLEIDTGYYYCQDGLFYCEENDLETWYYVCNDPDCSHNARIVNGNVCSAFVCSPSFWYSDGRIFFVNNANLDPAFSKNISAAALFSMEENGDDIRVEHAYEGLSMSGGGSFNIDCYVGGWLYAGQALQPDGKYLCRVIWMEMGGKETILFEKTFDEMVPDYSLPGLNQWSLFGDLSIGSEAFSYTETGINTICWFQNGEPVFTDASEIPLEGGYLSGNIVRCFVPGDGYYDIDLLTGERTRLENAQLPQSKAMILQPNCIIEATLLDRETTAQTQEMRFFDGQQWHSVQLPEELRYATPDSFFAVQALMSDRVVFKIVKPGSQGNAWDRDATFIFYCMKLDAQEYKLEYMGTFQNPRWSMADIP